MRRKDSVKEQVTALLKELGLPAIRECFCEEADRARRESLSYEAYLLEVLERERENRRANRIARYLRESKLPLEKSLEAFDRKRLPRKVDRQLSVLLEGTFLERKENVLAFGNPETVTYCNTSLHPYSKGNSSWSG